MKYICRNRVYNQEAQHTMQVIAKDQGAPSLSSTATVTIDVIDVNDNPPTFIHPNANAILQVHFVINMPYPCMFYLM